MKMKAKKKDPEPYGGDRRVITFFAWLPIEILGDWYWLELVTVEQVFQVGMCEGAYHGWVPTEVR